MIGLAGKRIVIAGGATGIGAALARRLVEERARLVVGDINAERLATTRDTLADQGGEILAVPLDLTDAESIRGTIRACNHAFGGMDGLAITAADLSERTYGNDRDLLSGIDVAVWERTMQVNLIGQALMIQEAIPHLSANGGAIVAVSSSAAYENSAAPPAYSASKAGLHALVRHVARLCGKSNIRCNGVAPGVVMTDTAQNYVKGAFADQVLEANALPRHGAPEDIAAAMTFLLSDDSSWITGQVLAVNGGRIFRD